ncbi:site-specific integrase, partial [Faecalibaculum rodentium]
MTRLELTDRIDLTLNIRGLSKRTVKIYKTWLTRFFDYVDVEDPSTITLYDCQKFLNHLRNDKNYAIRTHNQAVYALRHLCGTVLMIPYDKNALPRIRPPKTDKPFFSGEQVIQLIDQCEDLELKAAIALS